MTFRTDIAALAAFVSCAFCADAMAETLVYVTPTVVGTINSANPSMDTSTGGPLTYTLPSGFGGYSVVGADTDTVDVPGLIFLLARNGSNCQLFSIDPASAAEGSITATVDGATYACSTSVNDFGFFDSGSAGTDATQNQEYLVPAGSEILDVNPANSASQVLKGAIAVQTASGSTGNVIALANSDPSDGPTIFGIDATSVTLFGSTDANISNNQKLLTEANNQALGMTLTAPVSLDYSRTSSKLYLLSGGVLYTVPIGASAVMLGSVPNGTLSVDAAASITIAGGSSSSSSSSSGGSSSSSGGSTSSSSSSGGDSSQGGTSGGTTSGSSSGGGSGSGALGTAMTPTIVTPPNGPYTSLPLYIPITDATPGATIYYTTDGSTPTTNSTVYAGPVPVSSTETLIAIADAPGYASSSVASATFTVPGGGASGGGAFGPMTLLPLLGFVGLRRRKSTSKLLSRQL